MIPADWQVLSQNGSTGQYVHKYINLPNGQTQYYGFAIRGSLTSQPKWIVTFFEYDVSGAINSETTSPVNSIFDNYASLAYA